MFLCLPTRNEALIRRTQTVQRRPKLEVRRRPLVIVFERLMDFPTDEFRQGLLHPRYVIDQVLILHRDYVGELLGVTDMPEVIPPPFRNGIVSAGLAIGVIFVLRGQDCARSTL